MNIQQATKAALKVQGMIYRQNILYECGMRKTYIKPTNSYDACIVVSIEKGTIRRSCRNWNPTADDLIADDWEVSLEKFAN